MIENMSTSIFISYSRSKLLYHGLLLECVNLLPFYSEIYKLQEVNVH